MIYPKTIWTAPKISFLSCVHTLANGIPQEFVWLFLHLYRQYYILMEFKYNAFRHFDKNHMIRYLSSARNFTPLEIYHINTLLGR